MQHRERGVRGDFYKSCVCICVYAYVCILQIHGHYPWPHHVEMFKCKYSHRSMRMKKSFKCYCLEILVWVSALSQDPSLPGLGFFIGDADMVTLLMDHSGHESDSAGGLCRHTRWSSEAVLRLPLDFPALLWMGDIQATGSCSGSTCRPHLSNPQGIHRWHHP